MIEEKEVEMADVSSTDPTKSVVGGEHVITILSERDQAIKAGMVPKPSVNDSRVKPR